MHLAKPSSVLYLYAVHPQVLTVVSTVARKPHLNEILNIFAALDNIFISLIIYIIYII